MSWLSLTILAYFLLAGVNLVDKFLINQVVHSPRVYAFLISLLSGLAIVLAPWLLEWSGWYWLMINILVGALFPFALLFSFAALRRGDASQVTVLIGSTVPVFSIILAIIFLGESFSSNQWIGIILLLLGAFLIALVAPGKKKVAADNSWKLVGFVVLSALFYALFFIGSKYSYNHQPFWSAFIWSRLGAAAMALCFLISLQGRREILSALFSKKDRTQKADAQSKKKSRRLLLLGNQAVGAGGSILQNYAISIGPVAIINALQGTQYAFLLIMGFLATIFRPRLIKENIKAGAVVIKIIAILIISLGLYFITV